MRRMFWLLAVVGVLGLGSVHDPNDAVPRSASVTAQTYAANGQLCNGDTKCEREVEGRDG